MSGSFLENQYEKTDNPFELGPLAKKIKKLTGDGKKWTEEDTKKKAKQIVKNITNPFEQMTQQAMNSYVSGMMNQYNYQTQPRVVNIEPYKEQYEATNGEIAETLAELEYDDISDIVDRAYQIKSMKLNGLPQRE